MKRISNLIVAMVLWFMLGGLALANQIDVINHGTNLAVVATNSTLDPTLANMYLGGVFNVTFQSKTNFLTNAPPNGLYGVRVISFISNTNKETVGVRYGSYTNGATADLIIPGYSSRILYHAGGWNGILSARIFGVSITSDVIYAELGSPPVSAGDYVARWSQGHVAATIPLSNAASVVLTKAKTNAMQRAVLQVDNFDNLGIGSVAATNQTGQNLWLRFGGSIPANLKAPDLLIWSNTTANIMFGPSPYNGDITVVSTSATETGTNTTWRELGY